MECPFASISKAGSCCHQVIVLVLFESEVPEGSYIAIGTHVDPFQPMVFEHLPQEAIRKPYLLKLNPTILINLKLCG